MSSKELIRRIVEVAGRPTEVLTISSQTGGSKAFHALIIPGNPGAAGYYVPLMQSLQKLFNYTIDLTAISALGIGVTDHCKDVTVKAQAQHKINYARDHLLKDPGVPLVIVGHSIGAYLAVEVAHALNKLNPKPELLKVIALFPFLETDESSWRQIGMKTLTWIPQICGALTGTIGYLPTKMQASLIKLFSRGEIEESGVETTMSLCTYGAGRSISAFGSSEFTDLKIRYELDLVRQLGSRCIIFHCKNDTWLPSEQICKLETNLKGVQVKEIEGVSHGFCVIGKQSEIVGNAIKDAIQK